MFVNLSLVALLTLFTNVLGFLREVLIASQYGVSGEADMYVAAFSIAATIFLIFSAGSLQGALMPKYQGAIAAKRWEYSGHLITAVFLPVMLLALALSVVLFLEARQVLTLFFPGFSVEKISGAVEMLRIMSFMVFFSALGAFVQTHYHACQKFMAPAIIPILNNAVIIGFLLLGSGFFGIEALAYGCLVGSAGWLFISRPFVSMLRFFKVNDVKADLKHVFVDFAPLLLLLGVDQISALLQKTFVSWLPDGTIAALNYAYRLEALPIGVIAASAATVFFPRFVECAMDRRSDTNLVLESAFRMICMLVAPVICLLMLVPESVVSILFERGAFDSEASSMTALALQFYTIGMCSQCFVVVLNRLYFAHNRARSAMKIGVFCAGIHIVLSFVLVKILGFVGVAISTSVYAIIYNFALLVGLQSVGVKVEMTGYRLLAVYLFSAVMISPILLFSDGLSLFMQLAAIAVYFLMYFLVLLIIKDDILMAAMTSLQRKFNKMEN